MKKYLGVKLISAESCSLDQFAGAKNFGDLSRLSGGIDREGYKVVYEDGHTSWSPKDVFEKAYREITNLTFGLAIEALKGGKCVTREGWNGKGLFIFKQVPCAIDNSIIPKMQSVPDAAKEILTTRNQEPIYYSNQMVIVKPDGTIDSWVPSSSDIFAEDWVLLN